MPPIMVDRRTAIRWVLAAGAALQVPAQAFAMDATTPRNVAGYGKDPALLDEYRPGKLWPLTLTAAQRRLAAVLCDMMIPPDGDSPGASAVGVVDFIDEWISAPYPDCARDRPIVLRGFEWLDGEARTRFGAGFATSGAAQRAQICDELIANPLPARLAEPGAFFLRYRDLTAVGFYTTPIGMQDIGYRGNTPLASFDGPPTEVLAKLKL